MNLKHNNEHEETEKKVPNEEHFYNEDILGPTNNFVSDYFTEYKETFVAFVAILQRS